MERKQAENVVLEPLTLDDFEKIQSWIDSESLHYQWCGPIFSYPLDKMEFKNYCDEYYLEYIKEKPLKWAFRAIDAETKSLLGQVSFYNINHHLSTATVGPILVGQEEQRGQGIGAKILSGILDKAFFELKLHRVELNVFDFNHSAIRCYEKVGFIKEGLRREVIQVEGEYWNVFMMSILENEWKKT